MIDINNVLFLDIETVANEANLIYLPEIKAPSNYKDPEKIAQYVAEKKDDIISTMALDPDYGQIYMIGYKSGNKPAKILMSKDLNGEEGMLRTIDKLMYEHEYVCGYNILGFDLPYIMRRSMMYMATCFPYDLRPYNNNKTIDLMRLLYNNGTPKGLKFVAKRYGLEDLYPDAEGIDGSMVSSLDQKTVARYCLNDVHKTYLLCKLMNGIYI